MRAVQGDGARLRARTTELLIIYGRIRNSRRVLLSAVIFVLVKFFWSSDYKKKKKKPRIYEFYIKNKKNRNHTKIL